MAGGSGTRLWPLSRARYPKQFLALARRRAACSSRPPRGCAALAGDGIAVAAP